jgi:hypothetical protein
MAEALPNGKRAIAGAERIILWSSIIALTLAAVVSYVRTTTELNSDLDRNCRILVRIESAQQFVGLLHTSSDRTAQSFIESAGSLPNEICG